MRKIERRIRIFRVDELNNARLNQISRPGRFVLIDRGAAQKINPEIVRMDCTAAKYVKSGAFFWEAPGGRERLFRAESFSSRPEGPG